jgi:DNA-binding MarR family transcriptional regulator
LGAAEDRAKRKYQAMLSALMCFRAVIASTREHYRWVERRCGVSGAQVWALAQIAASPGMKVGDLASQLAIHQSTASNILEKLEQAGLVTRTRRSEDRRVVTLSLTPEGRKVLRRAPKPLRGALQEALLNLPLPRLVLLGKDLAVLNRHMKARAVNRSTVLSDLVHADDDPGASRR